MERSMADMRPDRQLALIAEVSAVARELDIDVWLRGGWAVDFFLGRVTREHLDIDFFTWRAGADRLVAALEERGFAPLTGPPPDQQRDFVKDGEEVSVGFLRRDPDGQPLVCGGPWDGEPFPEATAHSVEGRIGNVRSAIQDPAGQIRTKQMMPVWVPGRRRRTKDAVDIALLRAALDEAG
jgi:hypothetical protein